MLKMLVFYLQTLKQNTEVREGTDETFPPPKREISTQTPLPTPVSKDSCCTKIGYEFDSA